MSDEDFEQQGNPTDPPLYKPPPSAKGGARPGAGRKPKNEKGYRDAAEKAFQWIERGLVNSNGEAWRATDDEKKSITNALTEIFMQWDILALDNPYLCLAMFGGGYVFGKDRATMAGVGKKSKELYNAFTGKKATEPPPGV